MNNQDYGMFDISKGAEDSEKLNSQRENQRSRATRASRGAERKGDQSRVSSRFSQEACDELNKVAERIN